MASNEKPEIGTYPTTQLVVAVTGASGYLGKSLIRHLLTKSDVSQIIATDIRPFPYRHEKLTFIQQGIDEPFSETFKKYEVTTLVHLAFVLRQGRHRNENYKVNIAGCEALLESCDRANIQRIIQMSSSTVYGPSRGAHTPKTESAPLNPIRGFHYAEDKTTVETIANAYAEQHPMTQVSILRSCIVMGPAARNFITSALSKPILIGVTNCDPPMQFIHEDDLVKIMWRFISDPKPHPGIFNVAAPGVIQWSELVRMSRRPLIWLPASLAYGLTNLSWFLRIQNDSPGLGLDLIRWPWTVDTSKIEETLAYPFEYSSVETIKSLFDEQQVRFQ